MNASRGTALTGLRITLGIVLLIESTLFVRSGAGQAFRSHMPVIVLYILGCAEILGAVLFLIPRTVLRGGWILLAVFVLAIAIHLLHGMWNVGNLAIYAAATWAVVANYKG